MADRNRCMALEKQSGHRFADNIAPSDNHGILARYRDFVVIQHFDYAAGGTRFYNRAPRKKPSEIVGMKTVCVF